jgi:hypothetical protein
LTGNPEAYAAQGRASGKENKTDAHDLNPFAEIVDTMPEPFT